MSRTNYQIKSDGHVYYRGTLAQLLDTRDIVVGEPTLSTVPDTINPLKFLCNNLIVNNCIIIKIKQEAIQNSNEYLKLLSDLRYVVPPEKSALICIELETITDSITRSTESTNIINTCYATEATADTLTSNYRESIIVSKNRDECN